ncbi:MAG: 50S ribosomal protein L2 [Candidatus Micrarchaeia archaeon]
MGKMLRQQRRGKGSPAYRAPSHRFKADVAFRPYDEIEKNSALKGVVVGFVDDPARSAPLMEVLFDNNERLLLIAPEGIKEGDVVSAGAASDVRPGSILPLANIPDGMPVYAIECAPGDGGKLVRTAGSAAFVVSREGDEVLIRLPSKSVRAFDARCRAQVGVVAGGGRLELPFMKAGAAHYAMRARNKAWPHVRGVAMNPYNHPFGGVQHHKGRGSAVARGTPPGRKVGHLAARSLGRKSAQKQALKQGEEGKTS